MLAVRIVFLVLAAAAMIWHAGQSALQANKFFVERDFVNVARRLLVTTALGLLGGGLLIYLAVILLRPLRF